MCCWAINHRRHLNRLEERPKGDGWVPKGGAVQGTAVNTSGDEAGGRKGILRTEGRGECWQGEPGEKLTSSPWTFQENRLRDGSPVLPHFKISKLPLRLAPCGTAKCCSIHFSLKRSSFRFRFLLLTRADQKTQGLHTFTGYLHPTRGVNTKFFP